MTNWTDEELIIVCELFYQRNLSHNDKVRIGVQLTGRTEGAISMRLGNYQYLSDPTGSSGFCNPGFNCERIWAMFQKNPDAMHRKAEEIMEQRGWLAGRFANSVFTNY